MPKQTQSPTNVAPQVSFYTFRNLPPVKKAPRSPKTVKLYGFAYNDHHELIIVESGEKSVRDDIQAVRQPTLSELAARMPGKNSREKLNALAQQGILTQGDNDVSQLFKGDIRDETQLPHDILEAQAMIQKGKAALAKLDPEMVQSVAAGEDISTVDKLLAALPPDKIKAYYEAKFAKKETKSDE